MSVEIDPSYIVILVDSLIDSDYSGSVGFETLETVSIFSFDATRDCYLTTGLVTCGTGTDFLALLKFDYFAWTFGGVFFLVSRLYPS